MKIAAPTRFRQPIDLFLRLLTRERIRAVTVTTILIMLIFGVISFVTAENNQTIFGRALGADFSQFYVAGKILLSSSPDRVYDLQLQDRLYHELHPFEPEEVSLPCYHAPFFVVLASPLSLLPFKWAFFTWLVGTAALFVAGLSMLAKSVVSFSRSDCVTAGLISLSFMPFIVECWLGGQSSVFIFFKAYPRRPKAIVWAATIGLTRCFFASDLSTFT